MSYIGMELDALNMCPDVGDACGLSGAQVCHGLMRMWAWVFRSEQSVLDATQVEGFMYGNPRATKALVSFGFLEPQGDKFRVKGARRLLALREARRKGGHAAKKNLIPGARQKRKAAQTLAESPAENQPNLQPGMSSGCVSALTPTTDNRLPTTDEKKGTYVESVDSTIALPVLATSRADRRKDRESAEEFVQLWDTEAHPRLSRWREVDDKRRKAAQLGLRNRRLRDGPDSWLEVFRRVNATPFLLGENKSGWKVTLDWLLKPGKASKVLEGDYDDGPGPQKDIRKGYAESAQWTPEEIAEFNAVNLQEAGRG